MSTTPSSIESTTDSKLGRRSVLGAGAAAVVAGSAAALAVASPASAGRNPVDTTAEVAIRQLAVDYAIGTDAIAVGDLDTALARYRRAFSPDATIAAGWDSAAPALSATGPDAWAQIVQNAFVPHLATQHLLGSIDVTLDGRSAATMSSYLEATHVYRDQPNLLIVKGTYYDQVQRTAQGWRITARFLQFVSFNTVARLLPAVAS